MPEKALLEKRIQREISARKAAEAILESKSLELYHANAKLVELNAQLESQVEERTQDLAKSEARYRSLIEGAHDIIFVTNQDGIITYVNHLAQSRFGYNKASVVGSHFSAFIKSEFQEEVISTLQKVISNKAPSAYIEFPSFKKDDDWVWLGQNIQFSYNDEGWLMESVSIARDITQQKKEEELLISQELQLRSLIENLHSGVLFLSKRQEILQVNRYFCSFFGLKKKPEELIGTNVNSIINEVLHQLVEPKNELESLVRNRKKRINQEIRLKDYRYIKFDYIPIYSEDAFLGTLWQFVEVTAQKELELTIRNSEEKYRGIIENMELGLLEVDNEGVITRAYEWFCKMTGYTEQELLGKNGQDFLLPPEYVPILEANHEKRALGEQSVYEVELLKKGGERIWVIISGAPFYNVAGEIKGSVGIHFDVSDQKKLQEELIKAKEIAEQAQEAEQQFLASMSHEIRTPLNAVIGMSHLLYDTNPSKEQKEYLEMIQYSANLLNNLVTDILDFTKIKSGIMDLHETEFDLVAMLNTLHKTFELKAANKPIEINTKVPAISALLLGDETLINQVLYNLLGNAEKFTEKGKIWLETTLEYAENETINVIFKVSDTGIGISESKQKTIFKEFSQESRETKLKYGGTGLGLSIAKRIVDFLKGEITVESTKGKGTSFTVKLPLVNTGKPILAPGTNELKVAAGKNVLVVEDNVMNQNYIGKLLEKEGLNYNIANNGLEAFELCKKKKYDLIFMDISMPVMDGYEATIKIRNSNTPNIKTTIVALTASALSTKKNKAFDVGMNDYMTKPFTPHELKKLLAKNLGTATPQKEIVAIEQLSQTKIRLDKTTLDMFYDGDAEYAKEMFSMFIANFEPQYKELTAAVDSNDFNGGQKIAHKMKPTFSMVGAPALQTAFQKLEDALRHKNEHATSENWQHVQQLVKDYLPAIEQEYQRLTSL